MTNLVQLQRGLLALVKGRTTRCADDPYLERVAASKELQMTKEIALWWREFGLESYCPFTSRLLKRQGGFGETVEAFFRGSPTSSFIEQLGQDFLGWVSTHEDPLIATVARFERGLIRAKRGDTSVCETEWDRNPEALLTAILEGTELPQAQPLRVYRTKTSANIPKFVSCEMNLDLPLLSA